MIIFILAEMSIYHDEIEIEDMEYCEEEELYTYPCPCGDEFIITKVIIQFLITCNAIN